MCGAPKKTDGAFTPSATVNKNACTRDGNASFHPALFSVVWLIFLLVRFRRFFLFRRLVLFCRLFLPLTFHLLFLFHSLLLLLVSLFELLKLLLLFLLELFLFLFLLPLPLVIHRGLLSLLTLRLLPLLHLRRPLVSLRLALVNLRRALRVRMVLVQFLSLLDLLLFDFLAFLVLFQAQILELLLMLLVELRIRIARIVRARSRRPVVVAARIRLIRAALVCRNVVRAIRIACVRVWRRVVGRRIRSIRISLRWTIRIVLLHVRAIILAVLRRSLVRLDLPVRIALRHV